MNDVILCSSELSVLGENTNNLSVVGSQIETTHSVYLYISDLHLDYKIGKNKLPKECKGFDEHGFIKYVVSCIRNSYLALQRNKSWKQEHSLILLNGDISCDFKQLDLFFAEYTKPVIYKDKFENTKYMNLASITLFAAGNHEFWSENSTPEEMHRKIMELIIKKYRICYLQHGIVLEGKRFVKERRVVNYNQILDMSVSELRNTVAPYSEIILMGTGFSGYNKKHNAFTSSLYRGTIKTLDEDMALTKHFEKVYDKLLEAASDIPVICFTHTPFTDWHRGKRNPNWIYVHGHTHKNIFVRDESQCVFADNQVGYKGSDFTLKWFVKNSDIDPFRHYEDGIHYGISKEDYLFFNICMRIAVRMNRKNLNEIIMLKNNGLYMFFASIGEDKSLYMLDGGMICSIDHSLEYYYENMVTYYEAVCVNLKPMQDALSLVSERIKAIGGDGTIHGCIVDIDFYDHVYINPVDGSVLAYYADSMVDKWVYPSIPELLENRLPRLYKNYIEYNKDNGEKNEVGHERTGGIFYEDTGLYRYSRAIKKLQYTFDKRIIRAWSDVVLKKYMDSYDENIKERLVGLKSF